jgi:hypothetical protein
MQVSSSDWLVAIGSAIVGAVISWLVGTLQEKSRFRRELQANNKIDISGDDWYGAWQASADGKEVLNTERLVMRQKGATVKIWNKEKSPENPLGGFLWAGQLQFLHGRELMGWYVSMESENNTSKGIFFFNYNSARRLLVGKWVGVSYDGPLCSGFVVIAKERAAALELLKDLVHRHPGSVRLIAEVI